MVIGKGCFVWLQTSKNLKLPVLLLTYEFQQFKQFILVVVDSDGDDFLPFSEIFIYSLYQPVHSFSFFFVFIVAGVSPILQFIFQIHKTRLRGCMIIAVFVDAGEKFGQVPE